MSVFTAELRIFQIPSQAQYRPLSIKTFQFDDAKLQSMLESVLLLMDEGYADKLVEKIKNDTNRPLKKEYYVAF